MAALALLYDTETTGLFRFDRRADQQPVRLCSIAAELIDMETGEIVDSMHRLCDGSTFSVEDWRKGEEPHGAFEYNGLSSTLMMAEGIPIETILMEFTSLEDRAVGYVAYEAPFDLKVMRGERRRASRDDRYNLKPYYDPKWKMCHLIGGRAGPSQAKLYKGIFGEDIPRTDKSKARGDLHALRRLFLHALKVCQPLTWKYHKEEGPGGAYDRPRPEIAPKPPSMDAAS